MNLDRRIEELENLEVKEMMEELVKYLSEKLDVDVK